MLRRRQLRANPLEKVQGRFFVTLSEKFCFFAIETHFSRQVHVGRGQREVCSKPQTTARIRRIWHNTHMHDVKLQQQQQAAYDALERCARDCSERAWRLARSLLGNADDAADDAADVVQDAFLVVAKRPSKVPQDDPWPWFGTVIANLARNARRRRARHSGHEQLDIACMASVDDSSFER